MPMRVYRCRSCRTGFAIFLSRGKNNAGGKGITCPLCAASDAVEEVDPVESIGGALARRALEFWKSLPPGD